ncbi:MAG TPA: aminoglycoside phosphotransferase family protein [Propionibacteriaceae bacterium]
MYAPLPASFLARAARSDAWAHWLDGLPRLITDICQDWGLEPDGAVMTGEVAAVLPVRAEAGEPAVAKFGLPHSEAELEHLALRTWGGDGAVRLLRADPRRFVLLLERAEPGHDLIEVPVVEACEIVGGLYGRLHRPAIPQLDRLSAHAARWVEELPRLRDTHIVPRRFVEQAISLARDFASDPETDQTLIHSDLHYANVLAATRQPWLAIDPKPLAGDPAYEVAPLLWNRWEEAVASGSIRNAVLDRLFAVVDVAGLDEDRVRDWVVVREVVNVLWSTQEGSRPGHEDWVTTATTIVKAVQR